MASPSSSATMANSEAALSTQPALEERDQHQTVEEDTEEKAPVPLMLHVLEVEPGADIVQCLHGILESLQVEELFVISATGTVSDVTISTAGSVTTFPGIFHILSLSGSYFPTENPLTLTACREKVIAGTVHGILRAASPVNIVTGTYADPPVNIVTGTYADPSVLTPRTPSPSWGDSDNTVRHYSEAIAYAATLDSSTYDTSPIAADCQPHCDDTPDAGLTVAADYQPHGS